LPAAAGGLGGRTNSSGEVIGRSLQGRPITAFRLGAGVEAVAFVGDTHGAPEKMTEQLVETALDYYRQHASEIPREVSAYFIPTLNPDGLALGSRYDARGIDLNRNWATSDWTPNPNDPGGVIKGAGGPQPFSEPETRSMRDFLVSHKIRASVFYHLPWGGIWGEYHSMDLARDIAQASEYALHQPDVGTPYRMTGTAHRWADEHGQQSLLLELRPNAGMEWVANHAGMNAAMRFVEMEAAPAASTATA